MKIILFNASGDTLIADTDVVEEAEEILREYKAKGFGIVTETGDDALPVTIPMPEQVFILHPVGGG